MAIFGTNKNDESAAETADDTKGFWRRDWRGSAVFFAVLVAVLAGIFAAVGAGFGLWSRSGASTALYISGIVSIVLAVVAVWQILRDRRHSRRQTYLLRLGGAIIAVVWFCYLLSWFFASISDADIHDISTDLADPPAFRIIDVREDNWDEIPGADDGDMAGLSPKQRWERIHRDTYPDVRTVRVEEPVATLVRRAERLADDRGWDVESVMPTTGRLEARATITPMRIKQDIVLRVRRAENGEGSIVDMRAVSETGGGDLGYNAKTVRNFLSDLSGTTSLGE